MEFKIVSTNISLQKGTIKHPVAELQLNAEGIANDAHAGKWHRQVSLLASESITRFEKVIGRKLNYGEFAENITTEGFNLLNLKIGDQIACGEVKLEITQIGKECHGGGCEIFQKVGKCVMPTEGIFCKVISGGTLKPGDMFSTIYRD